MKNIKTKGMLLGYLYLAVGLVSLIISILFNSAINSLMLGFLTGLGAVLTLFGAFIIIYSWYMSRPRNSKKYSEMLENAEIECNDEMKIKLRNQAGRYAHLTCMIITIIAIPTFIILYSFKVISFFHFLILVLNEPNGETVFICINLYASHTADLVASSAHFLV